MRCTYNANVERSTDAQTVGTRQRAAHQNIIGAVGDRVARRAGAWATRGKTGVGATAFIWYRHLTPTSRHGSSGTNRRHRTLRCAVGPVRRMRIAQTKLQLLLLRDGCLRALSVRCGT